MHTNKSLDMALTKAISFIKKNQNEDGSFNSFSRFENKTQKAEVCKTTFYTSIILSSISNIEDKRLVQIRKRACHFLLSQKNTNGSYNYWAKSFDKYLSEACPDDLDDTSCALGSILSYNQCLVSEEDLANFTKILIKAEKKEGGPYNTWIVPKNSDKKWENIDLAVNANIGYFLSLLKIKLKSIDRLIETSINDRIFNSVYYPDYSTIFFISRFYQGKLKGKLLQLVQGENEKGFNNPMECALLGLTLLNLEKRVDFIHDNINYLLSYQKEDGSFGKDDFIIERKYLNDRRLSGAETLTASLVIELIHRYKNLLVKKRGLEKNEANDFTLIKNEVLEHTRQIIRPRFSQDLFKQFDDFLNQIISGDKDGQIILHPFLFVKSLKKKFSAQDNKGFLLDLAAASIFGWISYTIFDNITDEKKDINKLSLAIICNRQLGWLFCKHDPGFSLIFNRFMDRVDYANYYEYQYARKNISGKKIYREVEFIAEKSIAHSLVPLAILTKLGYQPGNHEFDNMISFFQNYLTARQLNDDAHDWEEDLKRGLVNYAGEMLIEDYLKKYKKPANYSKDRADLRKVFWDRTILDICDLITNEITQAKEKMKSLSGVLDDGYLKDKLEALENAVKQAIAEREKTINYVGNLFSEFDNLK